MVAGLISELWEWGETGKRFKGKECKKNFAGIVSENR